MTNTMIRHIFLPFLTTTVGTLAAAWIIHLFGW